MIVRVVAVLTIFGWTAGGLVTLSGLGSTLISIYTADIQGVVQGVGLVFWGIITIQLALLGAKAFVRTFAPKGLGEASSGPQRRTTTRA